MNSALSQLEAIAENPYQAARQWRQGGKKVVGVAPMHFPEELVHAAGMLPLVLQESDEPVTAGYSYLYPFFCGFTRSTVDVAAKGRWDYLDGVIFPDVCLQMRATAHILRKNFPLKYFEFIQLPVDLRGKRTPEKAVAKLQAVKASLEEFAGRKITDQALGQSISIYNRNRSLLRKLYDLRRARPGLLRGKEVLAAVRASMLMPKEEHSRLLESLLAEMEGQRPSARGKARVFVSGHLCQAPKADILGLIEEAGAAIVDDDLYTGYRYFASDAATSGDSLEALAQRYVNMSVPCPTRSDPVNNWGQYLIKAIKASRAEGVITLLVKFCEPHMFYYPHLQETLTAAGIPNLIIETEHEIVSLEGTRTRIQAFMEMLRGRK